MGNAPRHCSNGLQFLRTPHDVVGRLPFMFKRLDARDIHGNLQADPTVIDPFDGAIIVDLPSQGKRVLSFPFENAGRLAVCIQ